MKLIFILFAVIFCLVSVSGRNLHDDFGNEQYSADDSEKQIRDPTTQQMRHRRRSRQSYFDYNYPDYRRDYSRQQDDLYLQIMRLLAEISSNMNKLTQQHTAPLPPQPVYIPYPVPYYVPQQCNYNVQPKLNNTANIPLINGRWPFMEDERQNFGFAPDLTDTKNSDGAYPINLDPIPPSETVTKLPIFEQDTNQAAKTESIKKPGLCKAAVLACCNTKNVELQRQCFLKYECPKTFETGLACRPEVIEVVLNEFTKAYGPVN